MTLLRLSHIFFRKILLGLLIYSTGAFATTVRLRSIEEIDAIMKAPTTISNPARVIIWDSDSFDSVRDAQKVSDALRLAQAWDMWIYPDGNLEMSFSVKAKVIFVNRLQAELTEGERSNLMFHWLWKRWMAVGNVDPQVVDILKIMLPKDLYPVQRIVSVILSNYRRDDMSRLHQSDSSLLTELRRSALNLRVVKSDNSSCTDMLDSSKGNDQKE